MARSASSSASLPVRPACTSRTAWTFPGKVLFFATIIPQEGAWVDVETDNGNLITVRIGQTKKFPLTTLLRALTAKDPNTGEFIYKQASVPLEMSIKDVLARFWIYKNVEIHEPETNKLLRTEVQKDFFLSYYLYEPVVDKKTGEILAEGETLATEAFLTELAGKIGENAIVKLYSRTEETRDILDMFSTRNHADEPCRRCAAAASARWKTSRATAKRSWSRRTSLSRIKRRPTPSPN